MTLLNGVIVWDLDGTLIPADLRWLRRAIARTYGIDEPDVRFPDKKVHGYTDESIVVDTAINSGIAPPEAELGISTFHGALNQVMHEGEAELARDQAPYPGSKETIVALHKAGFLQTVLTGNLRSAAETKIRVAGLAAHLDLSVGGYGSDARDRFALAEVVAARFAAKFDTALIPARTVVIGDAPNDIACARNAGFRVVVIAHRGNTSELTESNPDVILDAIAPAAVVDAVAQLIA